MTVGIPLIRQKPFADLVSSLDGIGVNATRLFPKYGIPEWQHGEDEDLIPLIDFIKVFDVGAQVSGSDLIGRMVADRLEVADLGDFGKAIASSLTVYDGMTTACQLVEQEVTTLRFWLLRRDGGYLFCRKQLYAVPEIEHALTLLEQYTLGLLTKIVRLGAGEGWQPPAACMSIALGTMPTKWAERANTKVRFETPFSAIFVPNEVLAMPLSRTPKLSRRWAARSSQAGVNGSLDFSSAIRELLCSFIRLGEQDRARLEAIAEISGMKVRTLQRRLAADRQSFHKILDQARYQVAMELVTNPDLKIADMASLAGYENPQHFIRAFVRWTGLTPGQYRKTIS